MNPKQTKPQKVPPKQHTVIFTWNSWSYKRQMTKCVKETLAKLVNFQQFFKWGNPLTRKIIICPLYLCQLFPPLDYGQRQEKCPRDQTCKF